MLKIRLMRIGAIGRPFYRIVVVDERKKRNGSYLDLIGTYNPLTNPKEIKIDQEKVDKWVKNGAQKSVGFLRIIGKAPQRLPRKSKKEIKNGPAEPAAAEPAPTQAETDVAEEAPVEIETPKEAAVETTIEAPAEVANEDSKVEEQPATVEEVEEKKVEE